VQAEGLPVQIAQRRDPDHITASERHCWALRSPGYAASEGRALPEAGRVDRSPASATAPNLTTVGHRKNHVASSCYLDRWSGPDGRLRVVTPPAIESEPARPQTVGYRVNLWGRDPQVRRRVEQALGRVESDIANTLRKLSYSWPFPRGTTEWFALSYLVAIHLLRAPHMRRRLLAFQSSALQRQLRRYPEWTDDQVGALLGTVISDSWHAELFTEDLRQAATFAASMHWTLLDFRDEVLATSDQPVTVVPLLDGQSTAPLAPVPANGLADCEEIRMALDPRHALLLTWLNEPDDGPRLVGDDHLSTQLNRAVIGQADEQWFHHPARRPTTLTSSMLADRQCDAIGRLVIPGYGSEEAKCSQRRLDTVRNIEHMIEHRVPGELRIASVRRAAA
jgi:hypothetical protein